MFSSIFYSLTSLTEVTGRPAFRSRKNYCRKPMAHSPDKVCFGLKSFTSNKVPQQCFAFNINKQSKKHQATTAGVFRLHGLNICFRNT